MPELLLIELWGGGGEGGGGANSDKMIDLSSNNHPLNGGYDGVRRVSGLRRIADCEHFEIIINLHSIVTRGSESTFQWDTQICVTSSTF